VSGRASFELMQKAIAAGIPMLVAVGAPSSLAVEVAEKFGATLAGFTKASGFNLYAGAERVQMEARPTLAPVLEETLP
jgi:FdhD protein